MKTLIIDQDAVDLLDAAIIDDEWFADFRIPENTEGLRRVEMGESIYILSSHANFDSRLLVVNIGSAGVFPSGPNHRSIFERIVRVALRHFNRNIAIPVQWQPYHDGKLLSVFAESTGRRTPHRVYFDQSPAGSPHVYAFTVTDGPRVLKEVPEDLTSYDEGLVGYDEALVAPIPVQHHVGTYGILLSEPLGLRLASSGTLDEWYQTKLNDDQLKFVDQTNDRPIRLRGAAGTGKTQAMAVKCLRDLYADATNQKTIAFLTHSSALAHEVVRGMFHSMDPSERWAQLTTPAGRQRLWIGTLYELAQEQLSYEKKGVRPLSLDGRDGRELQRLLINDAIDSVIRDPRNALLLRECDDFSRQLNDGMHRPVLVEELMNEFACVLDAENVRKGTPDSEKYIRSGSRETWQMVLPTPAHRRVVLEIHGAYRDNLRKENFLSMDQMVADFGRYLSTHEWDQLLRDRDGFDLIFVDEYHYFTRIEAMTLQNLFVHRAASSGRWPLIMAYDLKQSTTDVSLGGGVERFRNPGVGESVPVDLKQAYRSSPQISKFLQALDAAFPALDLEGEFRTYNAQSEQDDGDTPILIEFDTDAALIDQVLANATARAREIKDGSQVAVLCLKDELFDIYRKAGRTQGKMVAVTSREDLKELRYARAKCVFSMPEYVAGLQFDTVFLIHADQVDLSDEFLSQGARRRYVSRAYLGASRAVRRLVVACSRDRGGPSSILDGAVKNGSLLKVL